MLGDVVDDGAHGGEFFGVFVADLYREFFFQCHKSFQHVKGIEPEIGGEGGGVDEGAFFNSQFFVDDGLYSCCYTGLLAYYWIHNIQFTVAGKVNREPTNLQRMGGFVIIFAGGIAVVDN